LPSGLLRTRHRLLFETVLEFKTWIDLTHPTFQVN
jgi:hypothetical protein